MGKYECVCKSTQCVTPIVNMNTFLRFKVNKNPVKKLIQNPIQNPKLIK